VVAQRLLQPTEQAFPVFVPAAGGVAALHVPGDRDGATAEDDAYRQDGEATPPVGRIDGQGQPALVQAGGGPAQQRPEADGTVERAVAALLVLAGLVEAAAALPPRVESLVEGAGEAEDNGVAQCGAGQDE